MAVMYSCCLYFSVRLGAILVAISSLIQSLVVGSLLLHWLINVDETHKSLQYWSSSKKLMYLTTLVQSMEQNTELYLELAVVFVMLHFSTSILLIYAALKCIVPLMWPYLCVEFLRLIILIFAHITAIILTKANMSELGVLITLSLSGGFLLLGLWYCWFCVISLWQCIQELKETPASSASQLSKVNLLEIDSKQLAKVAQYLHSSKNYGIREMPPLSEE